MEGHIPHTGGVHGEDSELVPIYWFYWELFITYLEKKNKGHVRVV